MHESVLLTPSEAMYYAFKKRGLEPSLAAKKEIDRMIVWLAGQKTEKRVQKYRVDELDKLYTWTNHQNKALHILNQLSAIGDSSSGLISCYLLDNSSSLPRLIKRDVTDKELMGRFPVAKETIDLNDQKIQDKQTRFID
jgi:hypothetical protein